MWKLPQLFYFFGFMGLVLVAAILWRIEMFGPVGMGQVQLWDFDVYYHLARDSWQGINPYTVPYMQTLGPPLVIAPFLLFAWLPMELARSIFLWTNLVSWLISCVLLSRLFSSRRLTRWLISEGLFIGLLLGFPARFTLNVGQPLGLVTLALTFFLIAKSPVFKALALALCILLKTFLIVPVVALFKREKETVSWCLLIMVMTVIGLFPIIRPSGYQTFFQDRFVTTTWQPNQAKDVDYYNQSLKATLQRLDFTEFYRPLFITFLVVFVLVVYKTESVVLGVLASIALSPVVWQHYFSILLPIYVIMFRSFTPTWKKKLLLGLGIILTSVEFPWLHGKPLTLGYGLLASHYFLGLLILMGLAIYHEVYSHYAKSRS